ncbi:MAG: response regulator [Planctomycetia bacterium]|nr:response regulator [Planctomycetia bacterium]
MVVESVTIPAPIILIADDDRLFRETVRGVLEPFGYRTLLAGSGSEAVDLVRREEVHLALFDMHMPWLTGLEALRQVKNFNALLPCILLSAQLDEALRREAEAAHVFSVLAKPVSRLDLTGAVQLALSRTYGPAGPWHPR